jgi:undecaprenyl-diphosphatase
MDWNTRLFLKINSLVGKNRWFDAFGRAGAEWVIFGMAAWFLVGMWMVRMPDRKAMFIGVMILGSAWSIGIMLSLLIGMMVKESRPHTKHPESNLLFHPLSSWKSFPSDHAFSAFLLLFLALMLGLPAAWALLPLALWVCWGRIYAGVHYPFDTVGGLCLAGLVTMIMYWLRIIIDL